MPSINVRPGTENKSHDISLSDGSTAIGLKYTENNTRVLQEIPISDPARPFSAHQESWTGGMGRSRYQDDPQGFYDAYAMWTMTDGKMMPMPQWKYGSGYRNADSLMPGDVKFENLFDATYISVKFSASASYNADKALFWLDWNGTPGTLTVKLCPDSAGDPDYAGALKSAAMTVSGATRYGPNEFDWTSTQALVSGTDYHLVFEAAGQSGQNYWRIATDIIGSASKTSADASTWASASYSAYYRVVDADIRRQFYFFNMFGSDYAVSSNDDESASKLFINGDRGITTGATSTTLSDTSSGVSTGWAVNQWVGAKVRTGTGQFRTIASNTSTQLTISEAWDVTPSTTGYMIYDTPVWQEVTGTGLGNVKGRPALLSESIVAFPQGQSDPIRKIKVDYAQANVHNFEDDGTNYADLLATFNNPKSGLQVWSANKSTAQLKYATATAWATGMTFSATGTQVGSASELITNMLAGDVLYVFKEDSIWKVSDTYLPGLLEGGLENARDISNGLAAFLSGGDLWFGWSHSVQKTEGQTIRDLLNYRIASHGLKRGGVPKSGVAPLGWKFFAMDSQRLTSNFTKGATGTRSSIICFNGLGWQEIFRGWSSSSRIRNVFWQSNPGGRSKLWCDVNGEMVYIDFPQYGSNPLNDDLLSHQHYAELETSTFDGNNVLLAKLLSEVKVESENDNSDDWEIIVEFQINEDVGTSTWYSAGSLKNLSADEFVLDLGEVNEWRLRFRFYTEDADSPAVLNSFGVDGWITSPLKYQWVGTFSVSDNQYTYDANEDFSPDEILDFLRDAHQAAKSIRMRSMIESMDMKTVVPAAPLSIRDWVRVEDGEQKWGGTIQVALREA